MDPNRPVPVPERQEADPYFFYPITFGHLKRFAAPVALSMILLGNLAQLPPLAVLGAGAAVGLFLNIARIHGVPVERWAINRLRHANRPKRYASMPGKGQGAPSKRFLPVGAIEHGLLASPTGQGAAVYAIVVRIEPTNYDMMNHQEKESAIASLQTILRGNEHHVQIMSRTTPFDAESYFRGFLPALRQQRRGHLRKKTVKALQWIDHFTRSRNILDRQYYLIFSQTAPFAAGRLGPDARAKKHKVMRHLRSAAESARDQITAGGSRGRVLTSLEARDLVQASLNPESYSSRDTIRQLLQAPATKRATRLVHVPDIEINKDHVKVGQDYVRTIVIKGYPDSVPVAWLADLLVEREHIDVAIHAEPKDPATARRRLRLVKTDLVIRRAKKIGQGADVTEDDLKIADIQIQLEQVTRRETRFYEANVYIAVHATKLSDLEKLSDKVLQKLQYVGVQPFVEEWTQEQAFLSTLPLGWDRTRAHRQTMDTECLTASYPFLFNSIKHDAGNLLGFHSSTGGVYIVDPFEWNNYNVIVAGTSGSGKSYSVKLDMLRTIMRKPRAWLYTIDPLREFGDTTKVLGGEIVYVGIPATIINPFELDETQKRTSTTRVEESSYQAKMTYLESLFHLVLPDADDYHLSVLMDAIERLYQGHGFMDGHAAPVPPILDDLLELLGHEAEREEQDEERRGALHRLRTKLAPKVRGPLQPLNGQTTVDLSNTVVTFDLNSLDERWYNLYMFVTLEFIQRRTSADVRDPKRIIIDEAWMLMDNDETARALDHMSRHVRHYNAGLTLITQTPESFLENKHGRAVLSNCMQTYLFRQRHVPESVQRAYGLDPTDAKLLCRIGQAKDMDHSECVYLAGNNKAFLQIHSSPSEHALITTDPNEVAARLAGRRAAAKRPARPPGPPNKHPSQNAPEVRP